MASECDHEAARALCVAWSSSATSPAADPVPSALALVARCHLELRERLERAEREREAGRLLWLCEIEEHKKTTTERDEEAAAKREAQKRLSAVARCFTYDLDVGYFGGELEGETTNSGTGSTPSLYSTPSATTARGPPGSLPKEASDGDRIRLRKVRRTLR